MQEDGRRKTEVRRELSLDTKHVEMEFKFEKLIIWQKAMEFGEQVNSVANKFPQKELYNLLLKSEGLLIQLH